MMKAFPKVKLVMVMGKPLLLAVANRVIVTPPVNKVTAKVVKLLTEGVEEVVVVRRATVLDINQGDRGVGATIVVLMGAHTTVEIRTDLPTNEKGLWFAQCNNNRVFGR